MGFSTAMVFFLDFVFRFEILSAENLPPQIQVKDGPIRGTISDHRGIKVLHFKGIPYAQPPIGMNRFLPPKRPEPWQTPISGSKYGPSCKQPLK